MNERILEKKTVLTSTPFTVEALNLSHTNSVYHRLTCPDWVNVLPITDDGRAVLIRQYRVGPDKWVLETPGGCMDQHEKDPTMAALRELEEETGYTTRRILPLLGVNPNPAIQTNRIHLFVALNCYENQKREHFPDAEECIDIEYVPIAELENKVRCGEIDHALSALCIMLAMKYFPKASS